MDQLLSLFNDQCPHDKSHYKSSTSTPFQITSSTASSSFTTFQTHPKARMRTAVIFALVIATFVAATSAAPSAKSNGLQRIAALWASKINSGRNAAAVLPQGHSDSEIIKQAILTTQHVSKALGFYQYSLRQHRNEWGSSEEFKAAENWRSSHLQNIHDVLFMVFWDTYWEDDRSPEAIRYRSEEGVKMIEKTITRAINEVINETNIITFAIKLRMMNDYVILFAEQTSEIADLWALIKGTKRTEPRTPMVKNWNQKISNPQQLRDYLEDIRVQATETMTRNVEAFLNMLYKIEDFVRGYDSHPDKYEAFEDAFYFYLKYAGELYLVFQDVLLESPKAADEAEVDAIVAEAMSQYEGVWNQLIPEAQQLSKSAATAVADFNKIIASFVYRYTSNMEPLIKLVISL